MMFSTIVIRTLLEKETDPKRKKMMLKMVYRIINN